MIDKNQPTTEPYDLYTQRFIGLSNTRVVIYDRLWSAEQQTWVYDVYNDDTREFRWYEHKYLKETAP